MVTKLPLITQMLRATVVRLVYIAHTRIRVDCMAESVSKSTAMGWWSASSWTGKILLGLQGVLWVLPCLMFAVGVLSRSYMWNGFYAGLVLIAFPLLGMLAVAIHECGHFMGAKLGGMIPYQMQIGTFDIKMEMNTFRLRWYKPAIKVYGYILAFPNTDKPLRGQHLLMVAGGPLANALAALFFGVFTYLLDADDMSWLLAGFALTNLGMGLANLVPTEKVMASDGLQLIRWWRGVDEDAPEYVLHKLNGLAVKGMTADQLPADKVALLRDLPFPMPLVHTWFVLKAHQHRAQWEEAAALAAVLNTQTAELTPEQMKAMKDLLGILQCEIAFSKSVFENKPIDSIDALVTKNIDWLAPCLEPRYSALQSVLKGDSKAALHWLAVAEKLAVRSIDLSLHASEEKLRGVIRDKAITCANT
jgi:hypothetical protein